MASEYISVKSVADRLGVTRLTIISLIKKGMLSAIKTNGTSGKWLVEASSFEIYLARMKVETLKEAGK